MEIKGCVGLVTGGNRGIGEAFVRVLLESGAQKVYAGSRDPAAAAHLVEQFTGRCIALELDVTDYDEVAMAARDCGDVSLVVNNAGLFSNQTLLGAPDMSIARQEMEVNYFGTLAMCRAFAPVLARNGGGDLLVQVIEPLPALRCRRHATGARSTAVQRATARQCPIGRHSLPGHVIEFTHHRRAMCLSLRV